MIRKFKNCLRDECIARFGQWLYQLKIKLTPQPIINEDGFQDLTPYNHLERVDEDGFYCKTLKWAIDNDHTKNIALTGVYGSGKSSVLRKFEQSNIDYKILDISLADFANTFQDKIKKCSEEKNVTPPVAQEEKKDTLQSPQQKKEEESKKEDNINLQELLERSIVQQMVYREPTSKLEYSRFKRIDNVKNSYLSWLPTTLWLFSILLLFKQDFYRQTNIFGTFNDTFTGFLAIIFFIGSFVFVKFIMRNFNNLKLNRIKFSGAELEIGDGKHLSIFNKHLDEILYFFEVTNYDVVIIEDLDRFGQSEIFIKLRELNMLINNYKAIKRKVTFLYALGDATFKDDKERTKFFDFIVPVIPVVTGSNSDAYILKEYAYIIGNNPALNQMISDLALFIEDMRSIKNIFNEFKMYQHKIETQQKTPNEDKKELSNEDKKTLFALIVYKNLLPEDFAKLNENKGYLYDIFHTNKQALQNILIEEKKKEKSAKEALIKASKNEEMNSVEELRSRYIYEIGKYCMPHYTVIYNHSWTNLMDFFSDEQKFLKLISVDSLTINDSGQQKDISLNTIKEKIGNYADRKKVIERKVATNIVSLQKEIQILEHSLIQLNTQPLTELLKEDKENTIFKDIPVENKNSFITYLVRSGHITENYNDLISFFYDGKMTHADREFLRNVKKGKEANYDYNLMKCDEIVKQLTDKECENQSALNFYLLDYLFTCKDKEQKKLEAIISQINEKTFNFISAYRQHSKIYEANFIQILCHKWDGFWTYLVQTESLNEEEYLPLILYYANIEDIKKFELTEYLAKKNNFLALINDVSQYEKIKTVLKELGVEFEALNLPEDKNELFDYIYENGNYVLNPIMIKHIISYYDTDKDKLESLYNAHLTTIKASKCEDLYNVVWDDIKAYISNIFLIIDTNTQESKEVILELLNYDDFEPDIKEKIIIKEEAIFETLDDINDDVCYLLFKHSKIAPKWENISYYFQLKENVIDDNLLIYLNQKKNYDVLANFTMVASEAFDDEFIESLNTAIIQCNKLSLESYASLINSQKTPWDEIDISMLSHDKINILIEQNKLTCNSTNFENLKELSNNLAITLIEQNYDEFNQNIDEFSLDNDDLVSLLSSTKISNKQKILLMKLINSEIIKRQGIATKIIEILLEEVVKMNDTVIVELIRHNDTKNKLEQNIQLLTRYMPRDSHLIYEALEILGKPYSDITIKGKNKTPSFENNVLVLDLMLNLMTIGYISSCKPEKNEISIIRKTKI